MYEKALELIGLSPNEAKIYEALLNLGEASVSDIAKNSGVHRRNIYDTLQRLIDKGLVFIIFQKKENTYSAAAPRKCLEISQQREQAFRKILPDLETLQKAHPQEEAAFIYRGLEGYKNYLQDLIRIGEDTYFLGAKAMWFTPGISPTFLTMYQREMKKKGKTYYTLFDPEVKRILPKAIKTVSGHAKVLPEGYATPGVLDIAGDYIFTFNSVKVGAFDEKGSIFVLKNALLAESYRTWFRLIWDQLPENSASKSKKSGELL